MCNGAFSRNQETPTRITPPIPLGRAGSGPTSPTSAAAAARRQLPWLLAGLVGLVVVASTIGLVVAALAVDFSAKVVLPLLFLCLGAATIGSLALRGLAQIARKLDQAQASEEKYKRILLKWTPLPVWVGAVASDDEIEDNSNDDEAMRARPRPWPACARRSDLAPQDIPTPPLLTPMDDLLSKLDPRPHELLIIIYHQVVERESPGSRGHDFGSGSSSRPYLI